MNIFIFAKISDAIKRNMKKISSLFVAVCVVLFVLTGCNKYKEINITEGGIESMTLAGLRQVDLNLAVNIENPAGKLEICQVEGVVMHFGKVIGNVTLDPFVVKRKSDEKHHLKATVRLDEKVGFVQLMSFTNRKKLNECTVDVHIKAKTAGWPVQKKIENIPLKELLEL